MKGRPSRSRRGGVSIGGVLMVASRTTLRLRKVDIRTGNLASSTREEKGSCQGEEAEDEEIEGEVVGDVGALLSTELLSRQRQTL